MLKKTLTALFAIFCLLQAPCIASDTITLTADADTYLDALYPDSAFDGQWKVLLSGSPGKAAHGLLRFDLGDLPLGAVLTRARLSLCVCVLTGLRSLALCPARCVFRGTLRRVGRGARFRTALFFARLLAGSSFTGLVALRALTSGLGFRAGALLGRTGSPVLTLLCLRRLLLVLGRR